MEAQRENWELSAFRENLAPKNIGSIYCQLKVNHKKMRFHAGSINMLITIDECFHILYYDALAELDCWIHGGLDMNNHVSRDTLLGPTP